MMFWGRIGVEVSRVWVIRIRVEVSRVWVIRIRVEVIRVWVIRIRVEVSSRLLGIVYCTFTIQLMYCERFITACTFAIMNVEAA